MIRVAKLQQMNWYLRSLGDHDLPGGWLGHDGSVLTLCGASFSFIPQTRDASAGAGAR
jgi:hypothetical protein